MRPHRFQVLQSVPGHKAAAFAIFGHVIAEEAEECVGFQMTRLTACHALKSFRQHGSPGHRHAAAMSRPAGVLDYTVRNPKVQRDFVAAQRIVVGATVRWPAQHILVSRSLIVVEDQVGVHVDTAG